MPKPLTGFVAIVDDDSAVRKALGRLLGASAIRSHAFASGREFLDSLPSGAPDCLIVDLQMPEMTGLELQAELTHSGARIPTIVITAHHDVGLRTVQDLMRFAERAGIRAQDSSSGPAASRPQ